MRILVPSEFIESTKIIGSALVYGRLSLVIWLCSHVVTSSYQPLSWNIDILLPHMVTVSPCTHQLVPDKESLCVDLSDLKLQCHCLWTTAKSPATGAVVTAPSPDTKKNKLAISLPRIPQRILGGGVWKLPLQTTSHRDGDNDTASQASAQSLRC